MVNSTISKSFSLEIEKQAGSTAKSVGHAISALAKWVWKHPKTTLGAGVVAAAVPSVINAAFKPAILAGEYRKHGVMDKQTRIMQEILNQAKQGNTPKPVTIPRDKLIERPLV